MIKSNSLKNTMCIPNIYFSYNKSLKIPRGQSEPVNRRRTETTQWPTFIEFEAYFIHFASVYNKYNNFP